MKSQLLNRLLIGLFCISLIGPALAAEIRGTITRVGNGGESVTIKDGSGKVVTLQVKDKQTELAGVRDKTGLKEGQNASAIYEGDTAVQLKVKK